MPISVELPRESGDLVMKALEMALRELDQDGDTFEGEQSPAITEELGNDINADSLQAKQADALVRMARAYLAGGKWQFG